HCLFFLNQQYAALDGAFTLWWSNRDRFRQGPSRNRDRQPHFNHRTAFGGVMRRNITAVLLHNSVADAEAKPGALANILGGIKRIENSLGVLDSGPVIGKLRGHKAVVARNANPQLPRATRFQNGVYCVVDDVQKDLLDLMGVGDHHGGLWSQLFFHGNVIDLEIVVAQGQRFFQHLPDIHLGTLGFALTREGKEILHHAVGSLRLFEHLANVVLRAVVQAFTFQQLRVPENRGQRIVQFVSDACDQLAYRGHLLALQKLFLGAPQIFVGLASLFVQANFFDGGRQLPADRNQQVLFP